MCVCVSYLCVYRSQVLSLVSSLMLMHLHKILFVSMIREVHCSINRKDASVSLQINIRPEG